MTDVVKDGAVKQKPNRDPSFGFGKNWRAFLRHLTPQRIDVAEISLRKLLGVETLEGKSFLDIGSGSGLFSLCAKRLGARVRSFDVDEDSVGCTTALRARYFPNDADWSVETRSVLDAEGMAELGQHDVVYSWGVLHHTGAMWDALSQAALRVAPGGLLAIALYNDQGRRSRGWLTIKRLYNRLPRVFSLLLVIGIMTASEVRWMVRNTLVGDFRGWLRTWTDYGSHSGRGMSKWHDWVDWIGGLPFEVSKPEEVLDFMRTRGFVLERLRTVGGGLGCNEYVFRAPSENS